MNKKKNRFDTKTHILNVAEGLFALNGFQRTTIEQLACEAKVNLAAVNYHFGSKRALVERVIKRRLPRISQLSMEELQKIRKTTIQKACQPDIKEVLRAFIEPALTLNETIQNGRSFLLIASRGLYESDDTIRDIFTRHLKPNFQLFLELMRDALPNVSERVLLWRIHFTIGSLTHTMHLCGFQSTAPDIFPPIENAKYVVNQLLSFLACGMNATCPGENEMMPSLATRQLGRLMEMGGYND
jgi:AcrR family transcriptional regulator